MRALLYIDIIINAQENIADYLKGFGCQRVHLIWICLNQCPCALLAENISTHLV